MSTDKWTHVKDSLPDEKRRVIVTNNISGRNAYGRMSHIWLVNGIYQYPESNIGYTSFDGMLRIWGVSHWRYAPDESVEK